MKHSGWRKPTPGLCRANALAEDGERMSVPKAKALLAVRRVAAAIGLKPGGLLLLDTLAAFTRVDDWEDGTRPLVWPSNAYLVDVTGLSVSAVKRHLRKLVDLGLITCKDSSNGKRWGRRDEAGRITEAYGFDLTPLAARVYEFEALYKALCAERKQFSRLKRQFTILRRSVFSMIHAALAQFDQTGCTHDRGFWKRLRQRYDALLSGLAPGKLELEELEVLCAVLIEIRAEAEQAFRAIGVSEVIAQDSGSSIRSPDWNTTRKGRSLNPEEFNPISGIPVAAQPQSSRRSCKENGDGANSGAGRDAKLLAGSALSDREATKPAAGATASCALADRGPAVPQGGVDVPRRSGLAEGEVTIEAIMVACPTFAEMVHGLGDYVRSWHELVVAADRIRPMIGISGDAWQSAQLTLGPHGAAAAVALITDKYSEGSVASPGGYLRGLCQKAVVGELQLARSVYGRLGERRVKC